MLWWTLRQLKSKNCRTRWRAAEKLSVSGDVRVVMPLVAALKDGGDNVRRAAARALGNIGDARVVEPLVAALKDKDSSVQRAAAGALGNIGDTRAVEPLVAALKDRYNDVQVVATWALGNIGDARAVEPLVAALKDKNLGVRWKAAEALGEIGDARAVEPMVAIIKGTRMAAENALKNTSDIYTLIPALARDETAGVAIRTLRQILEAAAANITPKDLRAVAFLSDGVKIVNLVNDCVGPLYRKETIDCSLVRQLARQELIRRGLMV